jgi:hypothetical protein
MNRLWVTNGSTRVAPIVNGLIAACESGFAPTEIRLLSNPTITEVTEAAASVMGEVLRAHDEPEPTVRIEQIDEETDFEAILAYIEAALAEPSADAEVAIDITPGRRFWSVISFQAGIRHDVEHLYYAHVDSESYFGASYATIPRTAIDLIDFRELV